MPFSSISRGSASVVFMPEAELEEELVRFSEQLHVLARETHKDFGQIVRQNGRLIAVSFAIQTQPFTGKEGNFGSKNPNYIGDADRKVGEYAVLRDITHVYRTIDQVYEQLKTQTSNQVNGGIRAARAFYAAASSGNIERAQRILGSFRTFDRGATVIKFDRGAAHQARRNSRGRVGSRRASIVMTDTKGLITYIRKTIRKVGIAKSGWAAAARDLGGMRGIPQWVTRHAKMGFGGATDNSTATNPHVILHNGVKYIGQVLNQGAISEALRIQRGRMEQQIKQRVEYNARKAGLAA